MRRQLPIFLLLAAFSTFVTSAHAAPQQPASADASSIVEQGKFTLHKFEQAIGRGNIRDPPRRRLSRRESRFQVHRPRHASSSYGDVSRRSGPDTAVLRNQRANRAQCFDRRGRNHRCRQGSVPHPRQAQRTHSAFGPVLHHCGLCSGDHADAHGALLGHARFSGATGDTSERQRESRTARAGHNSHHRQRWRERREA